MRVFNGLNCDGAALATTKAFERLRQRRAGLPLAPQARWSFAELRPDEEDYRCRLAPGAGFTLLAPNDLQLRPQPLANLRIAPFGMSFHRYYDSWTDRIEAMLGDEVYWSSEYLAQLLPPVQGNPVRHRLLLDGPLRFLPEEPLSTVGHHHLPPGNHRPNHRGMEGPGLDSK